MSDAMNMGERQSATPPQRPIVRRVIAIAVFLAVLGIGAYLFWPQEPQTAPTAPRPKLTVTVVTPKRVTLPQRLTASGVIAPWQEASIGTQIGSYQLIEVRVNVGDQVRRGDVLARINPALLRAEETQLLARHAQAEANDRRAKGLQANGAISDQEVLQFATEAKTASALLAAKRLELRYTLVLAPDDGVITARAATLGAVVPSGQELFRMIRKNRLEWRGELTAAQLNAVTAGQRIALALPDGSNASAVIRQTAPALDAGSRLAIVYADLVPGSRARAGMYVTGEIAFGESPALAVPAECVVIRDGRSYVMQVAGTAAAPQVVLRGVTTGRRDGDTVEILRGLGGGERLVLKGAGFLNNGDVVRIADARGAGR
ncbi:efflux RND transporter periplasmic adaptor subunit [Sphingomonas sp. DG1-23]|uniref:efflux RND transporter periplasmic adaptor subunit n=1 Tax=Sphingomonas sp. DG1-23 TaxID=3068316 RepID=UPI00273E5404|nr:efflux RND transporter periplasmic adaptor subunit [Sphingomonas sp. DG1-23]MDP5278721.1 efflux RND transporter periplasmic adaptor subunit [Sphingomonas sp. DG1-23]